MMYLPTAQQILGPPRRPRQTLFGLVATPADWSFLTGRRCCMLRQFREVFLDLRNTEYLRYDESYEQEKNYGETIRH